MMFADFGDLGPASLNFKQLSTLLDLTIQDAGKLSSESLPLDSASKIHLSLVSRLLSCAQRRYNCDVHWGSITDQRSEMQVLVKKSIENENDVDLQTVNEHKADLSQSKIFASSPFVVHILRPLFALAPDSAKSTASESGESITESSHGVTRLLDAVRETSMSYKADQKQLLPLIQILLSCAEIFPAGSCWSTNNFERSSSAKFEANSNHTLLSMPRCSPQEHV
jgi:hypothetical protein